MFQCFTCISNNACLLSQFLMLDLYIILNIVYRRKQTESVKRLNQEIQKSKSALSSREAEKKMIGLGQYVSVNYKIDFLFHFVDINDY